MRGLWRFLIGPFRDLARLLFNAIRLYGAVLPVMFRALGGKSAKNPLPPFQYAEGRQKYIAAWQQALTAGHDPAKAVRNINTTAALVWGFGGGICTLGVMEQSLLGLTSGFATLCYAAFSLGFMIWQARRGVVAPYSLFLRDISRHPGLLLPFRAQAQCPPPILRVPS